MFNTKEMLDIEKQCVLRFLYFIAQSDFIIDSEELDKIKLISKDLEINITGDEAWLTEGWDVVDDNNLLLLQKKSTLFSGWLTNKSLDIMNANNKKHHNEQIAIMRLLQSFVGYIEYPKSVVIPVSESDEIFTQMLMETPDLCIKKGDWWQKKKAGGKVIKRVGVSLSWVKKGKEKFVTAVNYELSTPGGSRCAEQNAIGMAIAAEPEIKFEEIKRLVIYAEGGLSNPCWPCGVCTENLRKLDKAKKIKIYGFPKEYIYETGKLPETMVELSVVNLNQRESDR